MKTALFALALIGALPAAAQQKTSPATLRSTLLDELHQVHDRTGWFVDGNIAMAGLTAQQAAWKDGKGNHSVGQLVYHIVFWNREALAGMRDPKHQGFDGNNDDTFNKFDPAQWPELVHQFDQVMSGLEEVVEHASDAEIAAQAPRISKVSLHTAYHIGEIVMVRKEQGVWDASKGVK